MRRILEICVDSLASTRAAIQGGADRLELCSALAIGGLTPYLGLMEQIREESDIPVRSMIRPRAGDFLYAPEEIDMMCRQIKALKAAGSNGFVFGCLTPQGDLDTQAIQRLMEAADGAEVTLHRCIDVSRDLEQTFLEAGRLGMDTVLTSGGAANCRAGMETIGRLLSLRGEGRPEVLIGAGVNAQVIEMFLSRFPEATAFHMSGKKDVESGMIFRRDGVPMGIPGFDEWHIQETNAEAVRKARTVLDA